MSETIEQKFEKMEKSLHDFTRRKDPEFMDRMLHPEFVEFGRSGELYSKQKIIDELKNEDPVPKIFSDSYKLLRLGQDSVLLTYETAHLNEHGEKERGTLRSSIWVRSNNIWQLIFHQGTPKKNK